MADKMTVYFSYETDIKLNIAYRKIAEDVIRITLEELDCPYGAEVSVTIVDDKTIKKLNKEFRGINKSTDVLSFPLNEYVCPGNFIDLYDDSFNPETGEIMLGDIVISAEHVIKQAEEYGHTRKREYAFLICHSVLHLCGFDHMEEEERQIMEDYQEEILDGHGYKRK